MNSWHLYSAFSFAERSAAYCARTASSSLSSISATSVAFIRLASESSLLNQAIPLNTFTPDNDAAYSPCVIRLTSRYAAFFASFAMSLGEDTRESANSLCSSCFISKVQAPALWKYSYSFRASAHRSASPFCAYSFTIAYAQSSSARFSLFANAVSRNEPADFAFLRAAVRFSDFFPFLAAEISAMCSAVFTNEANCFSGAESLYSFPANLFAVS